MSSPTHAPALTWVPEMVAAGALGVDEAVHVWVAPGDEEWHGVDACATRALTGPRARVTYTVRELLGHIHAGQSLCRCTSGAESESPFPAHVGAVSTDERNLVAFVANNAPAFRYVEVPGRKRSDPVVVAGALTARLLTWPDLPASGTGTGYAALARRSREHMVAEVEQLRATARFTQTRDQLFAAGAHWLLTDGDDRDLPASWALPEFTFSADEADAAAVDPAVARSLFERASSCPDVWVVTDMPVEFKSDTVFTWAKEAYLLGRFPRRFLIRLPLPLAFQVDPPAPRWVCLVDGSEPDVETLVRVCSPVSSADDGPALHQVVHAISCA